MLLFILGLYLIFRLVLIHDVPILQSVEERLEFENKYKGQKDIIFTYQKAIGTFGKLFHDMLQGVGL
jgi:hypothetical protein